MIVTRNIALRIAALIVLTVVLQAAFFSQLSLLGAPPTIVPAVAASLGLLGGALVGAVCGFALGIVIDSALLATLGVSSLVLLAVGYLAGRYRERFGIATASVPPLIAAAFTVFATAGFAALQLMLGVEATISLLVVREIVVQGLLAAGLGFAIFPLIRRLLAPALIDYVPPPEGRVQRLARAARGGLRRRAGTRAGTAVAAGAHRSQRVRAPRARHARRRAGVRGGIT